MTNAPQAAGFIVAWLYRPRPETVDEFERVYGPAGPWATLFGRSADFLGTELYRDADAYLVLDRWRSQDARDRFDQAFGGEYAALSAKTEQLYREETKLGAFARVPGR